jgi:formylglycine-generating enzyme required for sulfatase activity
MRRSLLFALALVPALGLAAGSGYVRIPGGEFRSALKYEDTGGRAKLAPFLLMKHPVTNGEFLEFVKTHPEWQRDRVAKIFAESTYLKHWSGPVQLGASAKPTQPVVNVSWFAAEAYCESQDARLPTWTEWEYTAAADKTRRDARNDPAWREAILGWYAKPSNAPVDSVGQSPANVYGVQDLHGLVWEWVDDYASMLVSGDSREQKDPDLLKFCGAGAISMDDRENYAVLMRVAMLSSLQAVNSTSNLGFRCAKPHP